MVQGYYHNTVSRIIAQSFTIKIILDPLEPINRNMLTMECLLGSLLPDNRLALGDNVHMVTTKFHKTDKKKLRCTFLYQFLGFLK